MNPMPETAPQRNTTGGWLPRLKLVFGKGALAGSSPTELLQRARAIGVRRIGVGKVQGWLELSFDGVDRHALPTLTEGMDNWMALEHPHPHTMFVHLKTEEASAPSIFKVDTGLFLDLGGMGLTNVGAEFVWREPPDATWADQIQAAFREAVGAFRRRGVRE